MAPDTGLSRRHRQVGQEGPPRWGIQRRPELRRAKLERYWLAFLQGLKARAKKPTYMAKTSKVSQKPNESPAALYERLYEAYWIYTPFDPGTPEYQTMVNTNFVGQAQPNIKRNLKGSLGKNATKLLKIENKVFINWDTAAKKEAEEKLKKKATLIVAAIKESSSQTVKKGKQQGLRLEERRTNLKQDECAYFKKSEHWKNECPIHQKGESGSSNPLSCYRPKPPNADLIGLVAANS